MRWGIEKRLEFIEFRLFWEGGINRADLMQAFGVSVPQASKDLSRYEDEAPGNLFYDKSEKRYFPSSKFAPVFLKPDATAYLTQLRSVTDQAVPSEETWLSEMPAFDAMPVPHRHIEVDTLRSILTAIRNKAALEIHYQSMNDQRPDPEWRWVTPHAFANDGLRWHVRAFCHIDRKFKDFLLSRCLGVRSEGEAAAHSEDDTLWHDFFEVILAPNPALSEKQQNVIAFDYNMSEGQARVPVRKALLYYFRKRLRLDVAKALDNPHELPVVVANEAEFAAAFAEATS